MPPQRATQKCVAFIRMSKLVKQSQLIVIDQSCTEILSTILVDILLVQFVNHQSLFVWFWLHS